MSLYQQMLAAQEQMAMLRKRVIETINKIPGVKTTWVDDELIVECPEGQCDQVRDAILQLNGETP